MSIDDIVKKSGDGNSISKTELMLMLSYPPDSAESYRVMAEANRISKKLTGNQAEIHAQFALNLAPCKCNCLFCSFAKINGVFQEEVQITVDDAVSMAKRFEADGANAIFVMTTANYPFEKFIEISKEVRRNLHPKTTLIANVGDQSRANAQKIKDAGYSGVYHALRLREGIDTNLPAERRRETIRIFQDADLKVGTCVEPVGPEHSDEELAEMILYTASLNPSYSGAARRIAIPGTDIAKRGMISEIRMAQIVAITRLGMPRSVMGNCTHEPCALGCIAGANLFWAEAGANPRDTKEKTENGRGDTVEDCRTIFRESGWKIWEGPSRYYMN